MLGGADGVAGGAGGTDGGACWEGSRLSRFKSFFGGTSRDNDMVSSEDRLIPASKCSLDLTDNGAGKVWAAAELVAGRGFMLSDVTEEGGGTKMGLSGSCKLLVVAMPETDDDDDGICEFKTRGAAD